MAKRICSLQDWTALAFCNPLKLIKIHNFHVLLGILPRVWNGPSLFTVAVLLPIHSISLTLLQQSPATAESSGPNPKHAKGPTETKSIYRGVLSSSGSGYRPSPESCPACPSCFSHRQHSQYLAQRLAPAKRPIDPPLLRLFQNPIPSLQRFCLPSDQDLWGLSMDAAIRKKQSKSFCCNATSSTKPAKCSLHTWCSLKGHKQDTQTHTASSEAGPEKARWIHANLTMVFHLTRTDLSVEIKYETVVASIVCILGVALNWEKEKSWGTGPDMLQLSATTSSLLHWMQLFSLFSFHYWMLFLQPGKIIEKGGKSLKCCLVYF